MANSERIIELFTEALAKSSPEERKRFLAEACRDDPVLKQEVTALLLAGDRAAADFLKASPAAASTARALVTEKPGDHIGHYKLIEKIGEGGCGIVYRAEQEQPVRREVALKIIKLGMDTRAVIARFEAERQALAMMDHPNIAKVHDAGATETGRPFFVMELVRGIRITDYCDQHNLSTRERLGLFIQVCQAIQHAHQKGIIHRDIKPSNILVSLHDSVPVPKVIDFGIAKATTDQPLTDKTVFTALEQFLGTPAYMSPEQARISGMDVDTRSDIYSLGVLLYELLTGRTPFDQKELLSAGLDEMRRIIREQEPSKPSTKLSTLAGEDLTEVARCRQADPPKLLSTVRGDLDWIVMKCLEKDRARRYETANGLASDIQRHLKCEPIIARPPSKLYEFQKTVRRHRVGFAVATTLITVLAAGIVVSTIQMVRAKRAENRAETVARFLKDLLEGVGPSVTLGRDPATVYKELLDKTAERVGKELTDQPEVEVEIRNILGSTYGDLGFFEQMAEMHRNTLRLNRAMYGEKHLAVAYSLEQLGRALRLQDKLEEAEPLMRRGLAMQLELEGTNSRSLWFMNDLGSLCEAQGNFPEAEQLYRLALEGQRQLPDHTENALTTTMNLGGLYDKLGRYEEAEQLATNGLALAQRILPTNHWRIFLAMSSLGENYRNQRRYEESERLQTNAVEGFRRVFPPDHHYTLGAMNSLAATIGGQGRYADAVMLMTNILAARQRVLGPEHDDTLVSMQNLASLYHKLYRYDLAEFHFTNALAISRRFNKPEYSIATITINLSTLYMDQRRLAEAETLLTNTLPIARQIWKPVQASRQRLLIGLIGIYTHLERFAEAEPVLKEMLESQRSRNPPDTNQLSAALATLGAAQLKLGNLVDAEKNLTEAVNLCEQIGADHWAAFNRRYWLGGVYLAQKKYDKAADFLRTGYEGMTSFKGLPAAALKFHREALVWLVQLYDETHQPDEHAKWKRKLEELDQSEAAKSSSAPEKN